MRIHLLRRAVAVVSLALLYAATAGAADPTIPAALGWYEVPDTALRPHCPPNGFGGSGYDFFDNCKSVTSAWNSAMMDTKRNRLIVFGGGHRDYFGNELYAVDLTTLKVSRLNDPGLPLSESGCPESIVNGTQPNARHTYDAVAYLEKEDRMWIWGGSLSPCGSFGTDTWTFDFATMKWEKRTPKGDIPPGEPGVVSAYDPNTGKVFMDDSHNFYAYDFARDRYERISGSNGIGYHSTAVIDPIRKKFVIVGAGKVHVYDIARPGGLMGPSRKVLSTKGGDPIVKSIYPGLAYDRVTDRIVAWNGGDTVYSLDLETATWTPISAPGGPGPAMRNGTFKRWSYSPASGVFVVVNAMTSNAFTFRLTPMSEAPAR